LDGITYSPDGRSVLTACQDGTVSLWDAAGLTELSRLTDSNHVYSARFSPDGLQIVTSCKDGVARVWDLRTGKVLLNLRGHTNRVLFAAFSHDGKLIVTTSDDSTARIWDAITARAAGLRSCTSQR